MFIVQEAKPEKVEAKPEKKEAKPEKVENGIEEPQKPTPAEPQKPEEVTFSYSKNIFSFMFS